MRQTIAKDMRDYSLTAPTDTLEYAPSRSGEWYLSAHGSIQSQKYLGTY